MSQEPLDEEAKTNGLEQPATGAAPAAEPDATRGLLDSVLSMTGALGAAGGEDRPGASGSDALQAAAQDLLAKAQGAKAKQGEGQGQDLLDAIAQLAALLVNKPAAAKPKKKPKKKPAAAKEKAKPKQTAKKPAAKKPKPKKPAAKPKPKPKAAAKPKKPTPKPKSAAKKPKPKAKK